MEKLQFIKIISNQNFKIILIKINNLLCTKNISDVICCVLYMYLQSIK